MQIVGAQNTSTESRPAPTFGTSRTICDPASQVAVDAFIPLSVAPSGTAIVAVPITVPWTPSVEHTSEVSMNRFIMFPVAPPWVSSIVTTPPGVHCAGKVQAEGAQFVPPFPSTSWFATMPSWAPDASTISVAHSIRIPRAERPWPPLARPTLMSVAMPTITSPASQ